MTHKASYITFAIMAALIYLAPAWLNWWFALGVISVAICITSDLLMEIEIHDPDYIQHKLGDWSVVVFFGPFVGLIELAIIIVALVIWLKGKR